jgi:hypothetical protein
MKNLSIYTQYIFKYSENTETAAQKFTNVRLVMVGIKVGIKVGNFFQYYKNKIAKKLENGGFFELDMLIPTFTNLNPYLPLLFLLNKLNIGKRLERLVLRGKVGIKLLYLANGFNIIKNLSKGVYKDCIAIV